VTLAPRRRPRALPATPRVRAAAVVPLTALVVLALGGCSATNPMTTMNDYEAADGVRVELGDTVVTNLLILTAAEGEPGTMLGAVTNRGEDDIELTLSLRPTEEGQEEAEIATVSIGGGDTVIFSPERADAGGEDTAEDTGATSRGAERATVDLEQVPARPGALADLTLTSDREGSVDVRVPVLDGTLPSYTDLVPDGES
jgi:hypothetical protein